MREDRIELKPGECRILRIFQNRDRAMCEELFQNREQEKQTHYSLGAENCLREFVDAGSSTSMSFS